MLGDMQSITDSADRVTQYGHYNKSGRVLQAIDYGWRGNRQACFDRCNGSAADDWPFHTYRPKKMNGNWCEPGSG